ncbi:hybrid sensor histidine kinase/response regulator [Limnobacter parvus]|uniref:histidine kinase n=1 Tax=Limnobacter parvus TaxID=2939690 RepID=A0ABT1XJE8_9BURK|nr:response regulator [Limnobacter parvus]MCR2747411.1 response regulator [Limnobacter parvus]
MKTSLRLKQGVMIALAVLVVLVVLGIGSVLLINDQRQGALEQSEAARQVSRLSTRMLVLTHTVSMHSSESNLRQWWGVHQSINSQLEQLQFSDEQTDLPARLDERLSDLAVLFSGYSHMVASQQASLDQRRSDVLVDRLISEAEQVAEISYKIADSAIAKQEQLTIQRKTIVSTFAVLFAVNSIFLLILIRFRVVKPLERIESVANEMRHGNLAARCGLPEGDELGDVAAALDNLAIELNDRLEDLTATTHLLEVAGRMCGVGAWTLNCANQELRWSKQVFDIVEADFSTQPTLLDAIAMYPGDYALKLSNALRQATENGNNVDLELQLCTYKGKLIWVHVFGEVIFQGEGKHREPRIILGAFQDITERKRVEEENRQAKEVAESASKAKGEFLSNISHEIRTPLNAVVGLAYILKQSKLDSSQLDFVEKLENAGRGLIELVSGVLDVSKIEAGAMELEKRPFSARGLLDSLADLMTSAVADKPIEFVVSVEPNVPDKLIGDETKLRQVLVNLAGNAIKFTENGYVKVGVTLDQLDTNHCVLRFVIQDTGLGMDPAAMKRLFQSFSQADSSISRRFGGSGVGLALSQKLVELMGSTISAVSAPAQGSLFAFSLVLTLDQQASQTPPRCELPFDVVVVDEFRHQLESLSHMTEWCGIQSKVISDAQQALNIPASERPHLYIVNNHLHNTTGLEVAQKIKKLHGSAGAKVILMARPKEVEHIHESLGKGHFDAVLMKPVSFSALKNTLEDLATNSDSNTHFNERHLHQNDLVFLSGLTVLAVDDQKLNLLILRKILETHGARVILAETGQAAIAVLSQPDRSDVNVCLMDVQMPDMDGLETCEYIRHNLGMKDLPILALTAGVMSADHQAALDAGMNEVLTKPLLIDKVLDSLRRWGSNMNVGSINQNVS